MTLNKFNQYHLILLSICFILSSCSSTKISQTKNDKIYKKENNELDAKFTIYHINDSISQLFYDINNENLIYKKTDTSNYFYSICKIKFHSSHEPGSKTTYDTGTVIVTDHQLVVNIKHISGSAFLRLKKGENYYTHISVLDMNKHSEYDYPINVDKTNYDSRQSFLIKDTANNICYTPVFSPLANIKIETETNALTTYTVDYFYKDFKIAKPPFSSDPMTHFSYKADSSFMISKSKNSFSVSLPEKGFYHIKTNDKTKDGLSLFVYENSFPKISNSTQMILATRYIMSKKEFDNCMNDSNQKAAIDGFWLDISGSNERARELIKRYYSRVQEANRLFTSHLEGWKTDRGMIYIVFGGPNSVLKRKNGEVWTYGEVGNPNSLNFSFIKVENPFSDNDYWLERNESFKLPWYQAVDIWRQGRVYLDN